MKLSVTMIEFLFCMVITMNPTMVDSLAFVKPMRMMSDAVSSSGYVVTWEKSVANGIRQMHSQANPNRPFMVGIVGNPGSGKSTSSLILSELLAEEGCVVMPHDGYHIPLDDLRKWEDSADAIYRRGAPDTFDPKSLKTDLTRIRYGDEQLVSVPGFDHARGDPDKDAHRFVRDEHKIVFCEGLYLLHDDDGWEGINKFFDLTIFVESDVDACVERLKIRNLCIPGYTPEEIETRCEVVDRANAMTVERSKRNAELVVKSVASSKEDEDECDVVEGTVNKVVNVPDLVVEQIVQQVMRQADVRVYV